MKMKKSKIKNSLLCLLAGVCCVSCNLSIGSLSSAHGNTGEVLVVMDDYFWKGACGDSIRSYLTEPVMGLPGIEPMFDLMQQGSLTTFLQKYRNIVKVNIDQGYEMAKLGISSDAYAKFQLIFTIDAPSADSAIACMYRNKDLIIGGFLLKGRDAIIEDYKRTVAKQMVEQLRDKYQVDIIIPNSYTLDVEKEDFVWIAREEGDRQYGILIWKEPYLRISQLETDSLIFKMNSMTRRYVPGKTAGSYMADEPTVLPIVKRFEKNGVYSVQMNGLWQMENDFLGGPYVSQTIVDLKRAQLVTAHGFVFYPSRDKRQMVRQLEAILHTLMPAEDN